MLNKRVSYKFDDYFPSDGGCSKEILEYRQSRNIFIVHTYLIKINFFNHSAFFLMQSTASKNRNRETRHLCRLTAFISNRCVSFPSCFIRYVFYIFFFVKF